MNTNRLSARSIILSLLIAITVTLRTAPAVADDTPLVRIASKSFTESVVLGEAIRLAAESAGAKTNHIAGLGGTRLAWAALVNDEIDIYPDYTGTIIQEILANEKLDTQEAVRAALAERGIVMSQPLGFNNTYVLGMREQPATELNIRSISDLQKQPELKLGFSNEFMDRADGWPGLRQTYSLPQRNVRGLSHDLAYRGIESGVLDVIDMYQTDAEIEQYNLRALEDDRGYFPEYDAVLLYRKELEQRAPEALVAILRLQGAFSEESMRRLNANVKLRDQTEAESAAGFLHDDLGFDIAASQRQNGSALWQSISSIWRHTLQHLYLTSLSLTAAILVAIPLGIVAAKRKLFGQIVLSVVGIVQTVPSLALFVFLIPLFGIGPVPAIVALFLYSLLGIVRNTYSGLHDIPPPLKESAEALGLPGFAQLRLIELPMAARSILAGIKTATVINVGTATLGGFIGAGGYGEPIFTGISRGDRGLILEGAIPAAIMALAAQGLFELAERRLVPKGLRLKSND